jgi:hypothetical protein
MERDPKTGLLAVPPEAAAHAKADPKSRCRCGHTGDGPGSQHDGGVVAGHGSCLECAACVKFTWAQWTPEYAAALGRAS